MMVESRDPGGAPPAHGAPGHNCLTGCAGTFKRAMREKRLSRVLVQLNRINENLEDLEVREEDENMREEEEKEGSCEMEPRTKEQQRRAAARKSCSLSPYRELEDFRRKCSVVDTNKGRKLSLDLGSTSELADLLNLDKISSLIQTIDKQVEKKRGEGEEGYDKEKRRLSLAKILRPPGPDLVEGVYTLTGSKDFDLFLQAIGTGPLSR
ncbi:uncharacterized protein LOC111702001 [Eurytemora carolleeae]|nr:uncharacterized protein LOC111702001 [Eurytemora carolleeae]|eukprot:XP_023329287.1 uncharacterized protein LOC111702001 [Eurytemora affinis]